jgi:hypothetical protein
MILGRDDEAIIYSFRKGKEAARKKASYDRQGYEKFRIE